MFEPFIAFSYLLLVSHLIHRRSQNLNHQISGSRLSPLDTFPFTISEAHSRAVCGRNNLTFVFCGLGFFLFAELTTRRWQWHNLLHFSLPLLSVLPLKADIDREVVFVLEISPSTSDLLHKVIVFTYTVLYTGVLSVVYVEFVPLFLSSILLVVLILRNHWSTLAYETLYFLQFISTFLYVTPILW